jgi:hypothetical protein
MPHRGLERDDIDLCRVRCDRCFDQWPDRVVPYLVQRLGREDAVKLRNALDLALR